MGCDFLEESSMRFGFHLFMVDPKEYAGIARACDESGWDSLARGDSPYHPETIEYPYPYTPDGKRFWPLDDLILDPWVAITRMAMLTKHLRFITTVLRMSVRKPLLEAKAACSVAVVSGNRLAVGVGLARSRSLPRARCRPCSTHSLRCS
jgi:alkanesulfonate monooxygenase SsuD/methylene tetrahydromethanopterin reductase-like flavin-dependent oxidoreductase (luciferase family)